MNGLRAAAVSGLILALIVAPSAVSAAGIRVAVAKNVELFSVLARLAQEGNDGAAAGVPALDSRFRAWRGHPAVALTRRLLRQRSRNSLMRLALRLSDLPEARPLDPAVSPFSWVLLRKVVPVLRDFHRVSGFEAYWEERRSALAEWAEAAEKALAEVPVEDALEGFFGASSADYRMVYVPLLERLRTGDVRQGPAGEEMLVVFGPRERLEDGGRPSGKGLAVDIALLEFPRLRIYGIVDRHARTLKRLSALRARSASAAGRPGPDKPWRAFWIDNLTAAVQAHLVSGLYGADAGTELLSRVHADDQLAPAIRTLIADYARDRDRYPTFESFLPELLARLEDEEGSRTEARRP